MRDALALAPLVVLLVGFEAYCLVSIARHPARALPKWLWVVICLASVPLGGILYLVIGRDATGAPPPGAAGAAPTRSVEPTGATGSTEPGEPAAVPRRPARATAPGTEGPAVLATNGLTKRYGREVVLDAVDLRVPRGSVFGLVGPNGAGKTTLLSIVAGLRRATAGSLTLDVPRDRVAVLPDTPSFDSWLTAHEVVDLARALVRPDLPPSTTDEALETVGLTDAAGRRVGGFSRGMLQRLGLAATIVADPDLLLLDEPCSALDPLGRREVLDLVARLGGERTVLFCSHILGDVQEVCDTVGVLRGGRLLYQGPLTDLLVGRAAPAFTLRVRTPADTTIAALEAAPWVHTVEQLGAEELRVTVTSLDDAERGLGRLLADAGTRVVSIVPVAGDLEHVFLEVTA